ncbi:MAG: hypothetical protein AAFZ17_20560 [Cyanobacteria bacterium J06650_10]
MLTKVGYIRLHQELRPSALAVNRTAELRCSRMSDYQPLRRVAWFRARWEVQQRTPRPRERSSAIDAGSSALPTA